MRLIPSVAIAVLSLMLATGHSAAQPTEDLINAVIKEKGVGWVAGKTSVSQLSAEERRKLVSFNAPETLVEVSSLAEAPLSEAPGQFDWRNHNGGNYVTPVRDQKTCGSCWAFSITAALETKVLFAAQMPGKDIDLSEQFLISCDTKNSGCKGGNTYYSATFIRDTGIPTEACYPYADSDGVCGNACSDWRQKAYKISTYASIAKSVEGIRKAVYSSGPVPCVLQIFDDFFFYTSGIYEHVTGGELGRHAVTVVGYSDIEQYFIVKNSWGRNWGEGGFFRIAYGEVSSLTAFGAWSVALGDVIPPAVSPLVSPDHLDFETIMLPDMPAKTLTLTVANITSSSFTNINLAAIGSSFSVSTSVIPALPSGAAQEVLIVYTAGKGKGVDSGRLEITCAGATQSVPLTGRSNTRPRQPLNTSPATGAQVTLTPILAGTPFLDEDGDTHLASRWVIRDSTGQVVYETKIRQDNGTFSDLDTINKEAFSLPWGTLKANSTYSWQVSYMDDRGGLSAPSEPTSFSTESSETTALPQSEETGGGGGGGCFIATAVYGSRGAWQVRALSQFRDAYLSTNAAGRRFVEVYYLLSPHAAHVIERHAALRLPLQLILTPLAWGVIHPLMCLLTVIAVLAAFLVTRNRLRYVE